MTAYAEFFGIVGATLSLASFVPYIYSILKKKTKPSIVTWSVWTFSAATVVFLYLQSDEPIGWTILLPLMYLVGQGSIALLALRYGAREWTHFDVACLLGGLVSIGLLVFFHSPLLALLVSIAGDFFGALPTMRKAYYAPNTEDAMAWVLGALGAFAMLLAVEEVSFFIIVFPLYMFLSQGIIAGLVLRGNGTEAGQRT